MINYWEKKIHQKNIVYKSSTSPGFFIKMNKSQDFPGLSRTLFKFQHFSGLSRIYGIPVNTFIIAGHLRKSRHEPHVDSTSFH